MPLSGFGCSPGRLQSASFTLSFLRTGALQKELPDQRGFRLDSADAFGGLRNQINQDVVGCSHNLTPGFGNGIVGSCRSLPRPHHILCITDRLAADDLFLRKVADETLFYSARLLCCEVDVQESSLVPTPPLQGQVKPPVLTIGQHRQPYPLLKALFQ